MGRFARLGAFAFALTASAVFSGLGCTSSQDGVTEDDDDDNTGTAQVAISQVPSDGSVGCIAVTATGSHSVTQSVDVAPGQSTLLDMTGLPVGTVSFTGNAYQGPCSAVGSSSAPTWVSDAVLASVNNVQPVMVYLLMHRSGKADVDVDFEDEPSCRAPGMPCLGAGECCSLSCVDGSCQSDSPSCDPGLTSCWDVCVDLMNDAFNCGACGSVCPVGGICQLGLCMAPSCGPGLTSCGGPCVDLMTDAGNCGACGSICPVGAFCQQGFCMAPSCDDGILNGQETGIDCGGPSCAPCGTGSPCQSGSDCQAGLCLNGTCAECQSALDCPDPGLLCTVPVCSAGFCGITAAPAGTVINQQIPSDCAVNVCDGTGLAIKVADGTDLPESGNECIVGICLGDMPSWAPLPAGTACSQFGGQVCDGSGNCI